jgi:sortase A
MLLRVGIAMVLFAVASAAVVVVAVNLWSIGEPAAPPEETPSEEPFAGREVAELPVVPEDWPRPSGEEVSEVRGPRYYAPDGSADLALTVEAIGLYDVPVISSSAEEALDRGVIHVPQTPMPWEERAQKNVYLAGHRLGYPGTGSRLVFYDLDKLARGDAVILEDSSGNAYEYRVSEVFVVEPNADWAVDPVRGRDMVTLQTCTMPDFENRLIVRADRA